ncbi:hypothetical protein GH714_040096 [Hevea brasiliensis]|uniref:TF-B3 domain-containing protein n=1 Tax=Hevea brasiliensis TaxID=3981 RepID=A0A6A6MRG7_HEVBR|nr:hypothetical protein GH714_040096 [Hevea brasiliensis]
MDGTAIELVIMKQLSQTDLSKNHNRISMPLKQIINEFLTVEEKEKLNHRDGKHLKGIDVMVSKRTPRVEVAVEKTDETVEACPRFLKQTATAGSEHSKEEKVEEEEEGYCDFKKQRKSNKKMKKSSRKCFDDDKGKEAGKGGASKKPKKEGMDFTKLGFDQAPDLPSDLRRRIEEMDGTAIELVIMKQLSQTDLSKNHNRISMPLKQILNEFLTVEEKEKLNHRDGKRLKGIDVMVVGPSESDDATKMCLKKWDMNTNSLYISFWMKQEEKRKIGSLKQIDDATFGKTLEEVIQAAEDELNSLHLLADAVLEDFHVKKANNAGLEGSNSCNVGYPFGVLIPRRKRTPRVEVAVEKTDDTVEACPRFLKQTATAGRTSYGSEHSKEEKVEEEEEGYCDFKKQRKNNKKMKKSSRKRCFDDDKGKEAGKGGASKKPKKEGIDFTKLGFDQAPDLPSDLRRRMEEMNGTEIELVIMKQLSQTDLSKNHNRISMPLKQIINEFLTVEEKEKLNHREGKRLKGIDVMVVGPSESDDATKMRLKKWDMNTSSSYTLVSGWYSLVKANKELLKENAIAQFWSFRIKGEL